MQLCSRVLALMFAFSACGAGAAAFADGPAPLTARTPIVVPGPAARFDYMSVDNSQRRLLAAHSAAGSLTVVDLTTNTVLPAIPVGSMHGIVLDAEDKQYIAGDGTEQKVVFVDRESLKITGEVPTTGPVDDIVLDPTTDMVYADHDDGTDVWVIDAKAKKLVGSVTVPAAPEFVLYDKETDRIYQNIKSNDTLQVIDPATNKVEAAWSTAPAASPHGLAIDARAGRAYCAGGKGKLVVFDLATGKILASVDIAPGTDQIAYDRKLKRIYCASRGFISVVQATESGATLLANVPSPAGAHTIAVDPKTHSVWVCYADKDHSYVEQFTSAE